MRSARIIFAVLRYGRRFGAAGFLLVAAVVFAGNDSQVHGRSVRINGLKTGYALPRGATSFVIRLTHPTGDRSFTFVNENAAAVGHLSIAVSNQSLAADSPKWSRVEGSIRFRHKRLFTVSLVGVDADYVRLTFQVEVPDGNGKNDSSGADRASIRLTKVPRALPYKLARTASN